MDVIITAPNSLHMLWQIPQYILITAGEIMLSITVLAFAFTELKKYRLARNTQLISVQDSGGLLCLDNL